jgi:hypothetical protein
MLQVTAIKKPELDPKTVQLRAFGNRMLRRIFGHKRQEHENGE